MIQLQPKRTPPYLLILILPREIVRTLSSPGQNDMFDLEPGASPLIKALAPILRIKIQRQDLAPTNNKPYPAPNTCLVSEHPFTSALIIQG